MTASPAAANDEQRFGIIGGTGPDCECDCRGTESRRRRSDARGTESRRRRDGANEFERCGARTDGDRDP